MIAVRAMMNPAAHPMVLLNQRVLQLDQDAFKRRLVEVFEGGEHRQAPNELRNQAILQKVLGHTSKGPPVRPRGRPPRLAVFRRRHLGAEADGGRAASAEMIFSTPVKAPPHTNRMLPLGNRDSDR